LHPATEVRCSTDRLLHDREVPPLTDDQERELDAIMEEADRVLGGVIAFSA